MFHQHEKTWVMIAAALIGAYVGYACGTDDLSDSAEDNTAIVSFSEADTVEMIATSTVVDPSCRTNIWCSGYNANTLNECEQQAPVDCTYFCNQATGCGPTASCSHGTEDHRGKRLEGLDGGDTCIEAYTTCTIIPAPRGSRWLVFNFVCECVW